LGRKVHPIGFRLGVIRDWDARWYAEGEQYRELLAEDLDIRDRIREELPRAGISRVEIERFANQISLTVHTARPGIVIGRRGSNVNRLRQDLVEMTGKQVRIDVREVEQPETNAYLVAESIASQLERWISHRRAMRQAIGRAMRLGIEGIKITCKGRLFGSEMARQETLSEGTVPLHTLRADIDYAQAEALTTFGRIGVKVWINKGEVLPPQAEELSFPTPAEVPV
jgi:small subunit ribosomal protein S3